MAPVAIRRSPVRFVSGEACAVMAIINVTPDSFSDGGRWCDPERALAHGAACREAGAQWLDIGGESTRPGADPVPPDEELRRVLPVVRGLRAAHPEARLSIDTRHAAVAASALAAGVDLVNDISGGADPALLEATAQADAGLVLMHMQGEPASMQQAPHYSDVVAEVTAYLGVAVERAVAAGVRREAILVDPGIGFGKTLHHNCRLLAALPELAQHVGRPLVVGLSRKSLLPHLLGRELGIEQRDLASHMLHARIADHCRLLRVHEVAGAVDALTLARAMAEARR